jgi:uncharacterized protein YecE (DUF72 family)
MGQLYIGTSGYTYKDWRDRFYPKGVAQKAWLSFYAQHFNAVEINATFYRPFPADVFARWYDSTPPSFRFVLKAPKAITHEKVLHDKAEELQQFVSRAAVLKEKLAAVLWQFPASAHADTLHQTFTEFLKLLPQTLQHVFEFRHASWFTDDLYALLNPINAGFVINDSPHFPSRELIAGSLMYVRFHGPNQLYNSLYSQEQLQVWADKLRPRLNSCDLYLFFNNTYAGQALQNARELRELLTL